MLPHCRSLDFCLCGLGRYHKHTQSPQLGLHKQNLCLSPIHFLKRNWNHEKQYPVKLTYNKCFSLVNKKSLTLRPIVLANYVQCAHHSFLNNQWNIKSVLLTIFSYSSEILFKSNLNPVIYNRISEGAMQSLVFWF